MNIRSLYLRYVAATSTVPPVIDVLRAEGIYLHTRDGKRYIDLISGIAVSNLGHCHPVVIEAITKQAALYSHTMVYGEHIQEPQTMLAKQLCALSGLDRAYFVNSGNEAIDGAMKLAKRYTQRTHFVSALQSYHGSGQAALSLMGSDYYSQAYRPLLPCVDTIRFGEADDLTLINEQTAAVVLESIQGEAGAHCAAGEYWQAVRKRCTETGALLVLDEIQTGMGRTGTMFAYEQYGIKPDILCLSKALGAGLPLGVFLAADEVMKTLASDPVLGHINTFGGNAVCCAAALAALNVLTDQKLIEQVAHKESIIRSRLKHPAVKAIHGKGLLLAVELDSSERVMNLIVAAMQHGLITDWFLFNTQSFRIAPPLIITDDELHLSCDSLLEALDSIM